MSRVPQPVLSLDNGFRLRPWRPADAAVLVRSCSDPDILRWNRPEPLTPDEAREKIRRWGLRWREEEAAVWAITASTPITLITPDAGPPTAVSAALDLPDGDPVGLPDGDPVGLIGLADIDLRGGSAEFLYWLLPEGRGHGTALAATVRVSHWALDELGLHRLRITHSVANPASCRVALGAGFPLEGTLRSALLHADGWHDEHLHARIRGDR